MDFSKFDSTFDLEGLKADIASAAQNNNGGNSYEEVPPGTYEVEIEKLELGETGPNSKHPGAPKMLVQFRIREGAHKNQCIFWHQTLLQGFQVSIALKFLASLDSGVPVTFDSFQQFADMLLDIHEAISGVHDYGLVYGVNAKNFKTYTIAGVFDHQ